MTEKQKYKLLKQIKHKNLKRFEIEKFCSGKTEFDLEREISSLCVDKMISMTSYTNFVNGVFKADSNDVFEIGDLGKDYLTNVKIERLRIYLPISISILALIESTIALIKQFL